MPITGFYSVQFRRFVGFVKSPTPKLRPAPLSSEMEVFSVVGVDT